MCMYALFRGRRWYCALRINCQAGTVFWTIVHVTGLRPPVPCIVSLTPPLCHPPSPQRLQAREDELDDWEPKRIARPEGVPEWGVPPEQPTSSAPRGAIHAEERPAGAASEDDIQEKHLPPSSRPATVLGPDGKPCRACNSKLAFSAAMRASKGVAPPAPTKVVPAPATPAPTTFARSECPPDGDMLGSSTWTFLHSAAAYYPDVPTPIQRSSMLSLLRALPHVYPCVPCAEALGEEYARETRAGGWAEEKLTLESAVKDRRSLARWLCGIHNEVNERLGKQKFDCGAENLDRRWKDGPEDGSCD